ncbi:efflux RND transporter permease subunit [Treponema sp.]|uniref:efflux RND transporter permease subunit n=1 Tax=Treponema sp. TaxID=166 RepID=UPI00257C4F41|nr:efflux RND transporter permease subunit [Treponema sp.]MBE6355027.1 efflux RND transporter permease subunit [Treponema sp.]
MNNKFYNTPKKAFFIFLIISFIFTFSSFNNEIGEKKDSKYTIYSVEFEYFGMDSNKIEELITIPLEERLTPLPGIIELKSSIEYSKSITTIFFNKDKDIKKNYLSLRNIVETLYNELPADVQKPRIFSSDSASKGVFCIAFTGSNVKTNLRDWIDLNLKKKFESIDGVSEVIISGGSRNEIVVNFDHEKVANTAQDPQSFASLIQENNSNNYLAEIKNKNLSEFIEFNTKLTSLQQIRDLPVNLNESKTKLGHIATIQISPKVENELVTLNGNECISVIVKSSSEGNNIKISNECNKILNEIDFGNFQFQILYDLGEQQKKLIKNVLFSLLQSFLCIVLIIPLFFSAKRTALLILLLLPFTILWTLGFLSILKVSINQNTVAGISIALGLIVDSAVLIAEIAEQSKTKEIFFNKLKQQYGSLISACFTTLIACIPLFFLDNLVPGIKSIAITIVVMITFSMIIVILFIPCFIYKTNLQKNSIALSKKFEKIYVRLSYKMTSFCLHYKKLIRLIYLVLIISPICFIFLLGKNLSLENQNDVIYCSIDYDPEFTNTYLKEQIEPFINKLQSQNFIKFIKSEIQQGSVNLEIGFKNKKRSSVSNYIQSLNTYVGKGFLYVPGANQKVIKKHTAIEIGVTGDDSDKCKAYAKEVAAVLNKNINYSSVVLNFKNNQDVFNFIPDRIKLIQCGSNIYTLSSMLRWFMFGPVADKWIENGQEYDIRIAGKGLQRTNLEQITQLPIPMENGSVPLGALGKINRVNSSGKIYHKNGRRIAYLTIEIDGLSSDKALAMLKKDLSSFTLEKGYAFSLNREIQEVSKNYTLLFIVLLLCIVEIFIILVTLTENFKKSLKIILVIPASLFIPLFIKLILNDSFQTGDIVGIIILSGISINNAVYIYESSFSKISFKIRNKIKGILVSSFTTILGALPLLFIESTSFASSIAFFMTFGIINSLFVSLFFISSTE